MTSTSDYLAEALLNETLRGVAFAAITTPYISLHSANPGKTGANELVPGANAYVRKAATFGAPVSTALGKIVSNTGLLEWLNMPAATVAYAGVWDALSLGNFLYVGTLNVSEIVTAGAAYYIAIGALTVELR